MTLWTDLRFAARTWMQSPALALVIVLTLAVGIGAAAAAVALAHSVLLRPLPFPDSDRLAWITSYDTRTSDGSELIYNSNRMSQFLHWQQHLASFEGLAAWSGTAAPDVFTVSGAGTPERVPGLELTERLLPIFGARPALGRLFGAGDDAVGAAPVVVLSDGYWKRSFGARPDVVGRSITVDNVSHTIVGVLASGFPLPDSIFNGAPIDLYLPLERNPAHDNWGAFMTVVGRLRPGVTFDQARAEVAAQQIVLAGERPWLKTTAQRVTPSTGPVIRTARIPVLLLLGGVGCVLLLACANLANLLLVRASGIRRELQVRLALGASTGHLLRQLLAESAVLAVAGGLAGTAIAVLLAAAIRNAAWVDLPRLAEVEVAWTSVVFVLAICTATTLTFGSLPLLHVRRHDLMDALRAHVGVTTDRRAARAQRAALVAQVAFALLLIVASGLLLRSLNRLLSVDPGFRPRGAVAMRVDPAGRLAPAARVPFFSALLSAVAAVPGVESAALAINLPMDRNMGWDVVIPGQPADTTSNGAFARIVSPAYFRTLGIRVTAGRDFDAGDHLTSPWVMAVNQTLARRISAAGREPVGSTLTVNGRPRQVIAVVADVKHRTLSGDAGNEFYIPFTQAPGWQAYDVVVRAGDPLALVGSIREAIWQVDRNQAIGTPRQLQELIDRTLRSHRLLSAVLGGFAVAALVLAALGVYGVVGYRVAQRTREIAIRVALGAPRWRVTSTVLRDALTFVGLGLVVGLPLALAAGTGVRSYLFGIDAQDLATLTGACALVLGAALVAAYLPARRAPRIDPVAALRNE